MAAEAAEEKVMLKPVPPSAPKGVEVGSSRSAWCPRSITRSGGLCALSPPPHSSRSNQSTEGRRHRHRRYVRADGTTGRPELRRPLGAATRSTRRGRRCCLLFATTQGSIGWADAYAKGTWRASWPSVRA